MSSSGSFFFFSAGLFSCTPESATFFFPLFKFDKQDLNWSLPRSKQSPAEAASGWGRYLPLDVFTASRNLKRQLLPPVPSPACLFWRMAVTASWEPGGVDCAAALVHLAMYAATSFSRLWAKRWLRKRSWPWGSRRLSRASMRLLLSRTWRGKVSLVTTLRGLFNDQSYL